jgi:DNA-binding response OmpR family regulator
MRSKCALHTMDFRSVDKYTVRIAFSLTVNLRKKLEDNPTQPKYLITETAVGYRLSV